jgi:hypothetical protein
VAVFLVSFDIKHDYSYQERYSSFVKDWSEELVVMGR